MNLPRLSVLAVDAADLGGEDERDISLARPGNVVGRVLFHKSVQTIAGWGEFLLQLFDPLGMGKVSGTDNADALELCPFPDAFRAHIRAGCA